METMYGEVETSPAERPWISGRIVPKDGPMTIMVATDGSRGSDAALRFAARLASRDGSCALTLITVGGLEDGVPEPLVAAARRLHERGISTELRHVRPPSTDAIPETIAREAQRLRADLLVVGSEGRDTLQEWVVGGVALRLIYLARCPVLVVRAPRSRPNRSR